MNKLNADFWLAARVRQCAADDVIRIVIRFMVIRFFAAKREDDFRDSFVRWVLLPRPPKQRESSGFGSVRPTLLCPEFLPAFILMYVWLLHPRIGGAVT